ncbi:hypothetical protein [uncultured Acetatifactor sp.]|uniref:hypothetical protein n=1 Tax=uncultured Acetatifactor sp. TaxID=1671927 RepID=UPI00260C5C07|nr:hypothetical protein [uncultured Acetatifactor sp.]
MTDRRRIQDVISALLCLVLGALTACGRKEEPAETRLGIDGYVYVPRLLDTSAVDTYGSCSGSRLKAALEGQEMIR